MNFNDSLFKSLGLVFVFLLAFNLTGNCLESKSQDNGLAGLFILNNPEFLKIPDNPKLEKKPNERSLDKFFGSDNSPKKESPKRPKKKDKSSFDSEDKKETSLKSYYQLKGVLEEVDMMVSGWI